MPLETCMILLDNSEFMRNGDYIPTRLEAQHDAANLLVGAKIQSNRESSVGVSAGTELLLSPTDDMGKILKALHGLPISGQMKDVTAGIQVASLALKHRKNKHGGQRIVLFIGTPLEKIESKALQKAGRQLKKNNIAVDVVALGELEANETKLKELVDAANGRADDGAERTCHLVTIPAGVLASDVLASSPILHGGAGGSAFAASAAAAAAGGGGGEGGDAFAEFGGVDPSMDPELAMALRVSMEEERARQERLTAQQASEQSQDGAAGTEETKDSEMTETPATAAAPTPAMDMGLSEEEALLQQALAMSMNENEPKPASTEEDSKPAATSMEEDDEAAAMQLALQMSMQEETSGNSNQEASSQQVNDPQFVNQLLGSLPGVDANDPAIQDALKNLKKEQDKKDDKKDE